METNDSPQEPPDQPDPRAAKAALREAEEASATVTDLRTPLWYFVALGALIAPIAPAMAALPDPPLGRALGIIGMLVWLVALGALMAGVTRRMGVVKWLTWEQLRPFSIGLGAFVLAALVLLALDQSWIRDVYTVPFGALIAGFGYIHSRGSARESA